MRYFHAMIVGLLATIAVELGLVAMKPPTPEAMAQTQIQTPAPLQTDTERRFARDENRIANLETRLRQLNQNFVRHTHQFEQQRASGLVNYATLAAPGNAGRFLVMVCGTNGRCGTTATTGPAQY